MAGIFSHVFDNMVNGETYYVRVFPINHKGSAQSELDGQVISAMPSAFPDGPAAYNELETIRTSITWTAPADGYYKIELQGASGSGGKGATFSNRASGGGGGGGGGCAISEVMLKKGDTIVITCGAVGADSSVVIYSSMESYASMTVTSGKTAVDCVEYENWGGYGGEGGKADGGNVANYNGGNGQQGTHSRNTATARGTGGTGGNAGYTGGNVGGTGESVYNDSTMGEEDEGITTPRTYGKPGFVKIYSGDTNKAA